ncbi:MAG: 30S ribosomal protein S6 [Endomicrobium sp.]|jgi:small subunit ribosomal protein S6|nr:30S ribosomal protein S6 [Endomicrobium sp.]
MNYESTFIIVPNLASDKIDEIISKTVKTIEDSKGIVKLTQNLGCKKFSYPIKKFNEGVYIYIEMSACVETIKSIENFFKFNDLILRSLIIKSKKKTNNINKKPSIVEVKENESATKDNKIT